MKKKNILKYTSVLAAALAMSTSLSAQNAPDEVYSEFSVDAGYSHGKIKRNVGIDTTDLLFGGPLNGIAKHQTKFNLWDVQATSRTFVDNYYIRANLGYGKLCHSKESFDATNLTFNGGPISGSPLVNLFNGGIRKSKKKGHSLNGSIALGYNIPLTTNIQFIPLVGIASRELVFKQYLNDKNFNAMTGSVASNVKQKERWTGPFIGFEMPINLDNGLKIVPQFEYHFAKYKTSSSGKNTGEDDRYYYSGSKRGHIFLGAIKGCFNFDDQWKLDAGYTFQFAQAKPSFKTNYIGNTAQSTIYGIGKAKKSKVRQTEHHWQIGLTYSF